MKDKEKLRLIEDKLSLECTLLSLSEEVEFLSQKNEQFLKELQKQGFLSRVSGWQRRAIEFQEDAFFYDKYEEWK